MRCLLVLAALLALQGPDVRAQAVPCDPAVYDADFPEYDDPPVGRVLGRYYEGEDGIGGLGCWVHPHPNGRDVVITPHSWGREPRPGRQGYITAIMDGITASRRTYEPLGSLDEELVYLVNDVNRGYHAAYGVQDGRCWMEGYIHRTPTADSYRQVVAHEVAHCFTEADGVWGGGHGNVAPQGWVNEALAEFLSSEVYPSMNREHDFVFRLDTLFAQPYGAHVLFRHYATTRGGTPAVLTLSRLLAGRSSFRSQLAFLDAGGFGPFLLEAFTHHLDGRVADPGGGFIPMGGFGVLERADDLTAPSGRVPLPALGGGVLTSLEIDFPEGYDAEVELPESAVRLEAALQSDFSIPALRMTGPVTVEGFCDAPMGFMVHLTHLQPDSVRNAHIPYTLTERDCDEEDPEAADAPGDVDTRVVGTWQATDASVRAMFEAVYGDTFTIRSVSGAVLLTLNASGQATLDYQNVRLALEGAPFDALTVQGSGMLTWGQGGAGELVFVGESFDFTATAAGMSFPIDDEGFPLGTSVVGYDLEGRTLTFTSLPDGLQFPRAWTRR